MTTSKPSQPPLFADGSAKPDQVLKIAYWPTPNTLDVMPERENVRAWNNDRDGRKNRTVLSNLRNAVSDEIYDRSISSPAAIPASHSLLPGSAWARKMTGISGRSLRRWLPTSALAAVFSRMCMDTSRWGSTRCYLTWKRSVTPAGRSLFLLRPSAPPTGAIASGYSQSMWPTPTAVERANEGNVRILRAKVLSGEMTEQEAVDILSKSPFEPQGKIPALWPTPNVAGGGNQCELTPHKGHYLRPSGQKAHLGLDQAVRMWPTPRASESENRQTKPTPSQLAGKHGRSLAAEVGMFPTPRHEGFDAGSHRGVNDSLHSAVKATATGKLSAAWVTRLMGYPDGWLDLDD